MELNCLLSFSEIYRQSFIHLEDRKEFIAVRPVETFQLFDEFTVFSYYDCETLKWTDHITGCSIGINITKNEIIEKIEKIGKKAYWDKIKRHLRKYPFSPAYRLEIQ